MEETILECVNSLSCKIFNWSITYHSYSISCCLATVFQSSGKKGAGIERLGKKWKKSKKKKAKKEKAEMQVLGKFSG